MSTGYEVPTTMNVEDVQEKLRILGEEYFGSEDFTLSFFFGYVLLQAKRATEAKEQAKLEAEALELFKTLMGGKGYENFTWSEVASKDEWLAVARRAREMAKEATE